MDYVDVNKDSYDSDETFFSFDETEECSKKEFQVAEDADLNPSPNNNSTISIEQLKTLEKQSNFQEDINQDKSKITDLKTIGRPRKSVNNRKKLPGWAKEKTNRVPFALRRTKNDNFSNYASCTGNVTKLNILKKSFKKLRNMFNNWNNSTLTLQRHQVVSVLEFLEKKEHVLKELLQHSNMEEEEIECEMVLQGCEKLIGDYKTKLTIFDINSENIMSYAKEILDISGSTSTSVNEECSGPTMKSSEVTPEEHSADAELDQQILDQHVHERRKTSNETEDMLQIPLNNLTKAQSNLSKNILGQCETINSHVAQPSIPANSSVLGNTFCLHESMKKISINSSCSTETNQHNLNNEHLTLNTQNKNVTDNKTNKNNRFNITKPKENTAEISLMQNCPTKKQILMKFNKKNVPAVQKTVAISKRMEKSTQISLEDKFAQLIAKDKAKIKLDERKCYPVLDIRAQNITESLSNKPNPYYIINKSSQTIQRTTSTNSNCAIFTKDKTQLSLPSKIVVDNNITKKNVQVSPEVMENKQTVLVNKAIEYQQITLDNTENSKVSIVAEPEKMFSLPFSMLDVTAKIVHNPCDVSIECFKKMTDDEIFQCMFD